MRTPNKHQVLEIDFYESFLNELKKPFKKVLSLKSLQIILLDKEKDDA